MRGGWYSFESRFIKNIPIPHSIEEHEQIEALVTQILAQKRAAPTADTGALEAEIDRLVYGLYGLTKEEIDIIENSTR